MSSAGLRSSRLRSTSDASFADAVLASDSLRGSLQLLGINITGGAYRTARLRINRLGLDTSHFSSSTRSSKRISSAEVLVLRDPGAGRRSAKMLRRALLEYGRAMTCEICGIGGSWNGADLVLEVDHRNGLHYDDRPGNLRFLCPNCHSQVPTSRRPRRPIGRCFNCRVPVSARASRCRSCARLHRSLSDSRPHPTKIEWPPVDELIERTRNASFLSVARELGVSDNAIRKRIARSGQA